MTPTSSKLNTTRTRSSTCYPPSLLLPLHHHIHTKMLPRHLPFSTRVLGSTRSRSKSPTTPLCLPTTTTVPRRNLPLVVWITSRGVSLAPVRVFCEGKVFTPPVDVKVFPGNLNKGIYVTLGSRDNEEYNLTHPCASISGFLKANLYITVSEQTIITCPKTMMKAILEYKDEVTDRLRSSRSHHSFG